MELRVMRPSFLGFDVLEVGVEVVSNRNVTTVVDVERRLDEGVLPNLAQHLGQDPLPLGHQRVVRGIVGEIAVVFVHKSPGTKSSLDKLRRLRVVPARER